MKTIIAATDFSPSASNALQYAGALAAQTNAKLILLNAFQLSLHASNSLISAAGVEDLFQSNKKRLQNLAEAIALKFRINTVVYSKMAFLADALAEAVPEMNADLVVLGMHVNDWGDRMFGNKTIEIIVNATYPLLIVPEKVAYKGISRILFAFDNKCVSSQNKLFALKDVAKSFEAEVEVFHVETATAHMAASNQVAGPDLRIEAALAHVDHAYKEVEGKNVSDAIEKELIEYNADLLAVVPHKAGLLNRLLNRSVTRKLALELPVSLLVLPNDCVVVDNDNTAW
jgi:nucleotide-binding universal stress UspA family protein